MQWSIRLLVVLALLVAAPVHAATITITTTPEFDAAMVTLRTKLNAERPVPLTAAQFRDYLVAQWMDGLVSQAGTHDQTTIREAWEKANDATRAKVKTDLGLQ